MSESSDPLSAPLSDAEKEAQWEADLAEALANAGPITRKLYGIAKGDADEEDYKRYLLEKYG